MQKLIEVSVRKTMNAVFDAGVPGVASIAFVVTAGIFRYFELI